MSRIRLFLLGIALAAALAGAAFKLGPANNSVIVMTEAGAVRGAVRGDVASFMNIPYAAAPVGELRWRAPRLAPSWQEVRDATAFGPSCMQPGDMPKSEDCLTLNVWRPAAAPKSPLAVMVWIHGGALVAGGASSYPGDALARRGVVVVTLNYRLGRLGFFAHPALAAEAPDDARGNYGFLDQRAALQWVQRNIAAFGGDPKAVTLFGESAGGGSVMVHLTAPMSRGLFQRAILQSPGLPTAREKVLPLTELAEAEKLAVAYARTLGVTASGSAALAALRALPAGKLAEGASGTEVVEALADGAPVAGVAGSIRDGKFVVEAPDKVFAAGRQTPAPMIVGANDRDMALGTAASKDELFAVFGTNAAEARALYDPNGDATLDQLKQEVFADKTMTEPVRHLADEVARSGQSVWLYRFSYVAESRRGKQNGAGHAEEIPYVFDVPTAFVGSRATPADDAMGDTASGYWVAFAKTGDPAGGDRPAWPRYDPALDRLMNFNNSGAVVGADPLKPRLDLWRKVWDR